MSKWDSENTSFNKSAKYTKKNRFTALCCPKDDTLHKNKPVKGKVKSKRDLIFSVTICTSKDFNYQHQYRSNSNDKSAQICYHSTHSVSSPF